MERQSDLASDNRRRTALRVTAVVITITVVGCLLGPSGTVVGVEFSPDIVAHRSFRYYQWCGVQLTPRQYSVWQSDVDRYLHEQGFVATPDGSHTRWFFVKGSAPHVRGWFGEAKSMCQGTGCYRGSDQWVKWSRDNPELAQVVWPRVLAWSRDEQFATVYLFFKLTELDQAQTVAEVEQKLTRAEQMATE